VKSTAQSEFRAGAGSLGPLHHPSGGRRRCRWDQTGVEVPVHATSISSRTDTSRRHGSPVHSEITTLDRMGGLVYGRTSRSVGCSSLSDTRTNHTSVFAGSARPLPAVGDVDGDDPAPTVNAAEPSRTRSRPCGMSPETAVWTSCSRRSANPHLPPGNRDGHRDAELRCRPERSHVSSDSPSAGRSTARLLTEMTVSVVLARHPAAAGQGVLVECAGLLLSAAQSEIRRVPDRLVLRVTRGAAADAAGGTGLESKCWYEAPASRD
jgi:hypothetical protein